MAKRNLVRFACGHYRHVSDSVLATLPIEHIAGNQFKCSQPARTVLRSFRELGAVEPTLPDGPYPGTIDGAPLVVVTVTGAKYTEFPLQSAKALIEYGLKRAKTDAEGPLGRIVTNIEIPR